MSITPPVTTGAIQTISCRLCDAPAERRFSLDLIVRHKVHYYECTKCGSLQTEPPYWLDEAYANSNLARLDTGAAQRNLTNLGAILSWVKIAGIRTVVDIGGGDGLFCRLLRDYGVDARLEDRYAMNTYAQGFDDGPRHAPILFTAFEVLEHYPTPKDDLATLFETKPESIVVTTTLYDGQGPDWWYLTPDSGQHVFFYTRHAMQLIGDRFGYDVSFAGHYTLFNRPGRVGSGRLAIAKAAMSNIGSRLLRSAVMVLPAKGAVEDFNAINGTKTLR